MSINKQTTVWCDGDEGDCCQWAALALGAGLALTAKSLRKTLKKAGWTHKGKLDFCPRCSKATDAKSKGTNK